jgi:ankyrin repeat protein
MNTMVNIWAAARNEDLEAIQRYADGGGDLEVGAMLWAKTPLFYSLQLGKKESYRKLLELGASPNTLCRRGNVVMHFAAAKKDTYWLRLALDSGGDPNLFNERGYGSIRTRPLALAIGAGSLESVKLLCDRGADINAPDPQNCTPLTLACDHAEFEIVHYLLERGADYNKSAPRVFTFVFSLREKYPPSHYHNYPDDTEKWCRAVFDWMIAHDADPEKATWDGSKWVFGQRE